VEVLVAAQPRGDVEHDARDARQHAGEHERRVDADRDTGPVSAKDTGVSPIDTNQSSECTPPR